MIYFPCIEGTGISTAISKLQPTAPQLFAPGVVFWKTKPVIPDSSRLTPAQIDAFHGDGFLVVDQWFAPAEVELLKQETYREFAVDKPGRVLEKSGAERTQSHAGG